jgi:hypothetical protein
MPWCVMHSQSNYPNICPDKLWVVTELLICIKGCRFIFWDISFWHSRLIFISNLFPLRNRLMLAHKQYRFIFQSWSRTGISITVIPICILYSVKCRTICHSSCPLFVLIRLLIIKIIIYNLTADVCLFIWFTVCYSI